MRYQSSVTFADGTVIDSEFVVISIIEALSLARSIVAGYNSVGEGFIAPTDVNIKIIYGQEF